jgi:hypothetical protein
LIFPGEYYILLLLKTEIDTLLVAGWLKVVKIKKKEKKIATLVRSLSELAAH